MKITVEMSEMANRLGIAIELRAGRRIVFHTPRNGQIAFASVHDAKVWLEGAMFALNAAETR